ncbi:MAG: hypothetical protein WCD76_12115 [Pyrinomonadaceae bacterium]
MSKQNENRISDPSVRLSVQEGDSSPRLNVTGKKEFVEPDISTPVDVLEATTFFQGTDSGGTGSPE